MKKLILSAAAIAMTIGLATATPGASAKDHDPELMTAAGTNKDGMVSRDEFMAAMGKIYDDKVVKYEQMTVDGYRALWREISGGQ